VTSSRREKLDDWRVKENVRREQVLESLGLHGPLDHADLAEVTGIDLKQLQPVVERMLARGEIKVEGSALRLPPLTDQDAVIDCDEEGDS
jgi:hypothetical protein